MHRIISVEEAQKLSNPIYIDMRSPSEYTLGHIPGAVNIPLFTDDERAQVGTVYKQVSTEEAKHLGLSIVSSKLPDLVRQVRDLHKTGREVIIYCWRGGMRSKSVVTVLEIMGIPASQLLGGYKQYRQHVLQSLRDFDLKPQIVVLCGSTGVGKTTLLTMLADHGAAVIDLEKLANHRGSAFGHVGIGLPETAQNFDALLLQELKRLNESPYILVECESKRIGNVYLPDVLFLAMKQGKKILATASINTRIARLIEEYTDISSSNSKAITHCLRTLEKKLGTKRAGKLIEQMQQGEIKQVVHSLLVDYYDPLYGYENADPSSYDYVVDANDLAAASVKIMDYLNTIGR